MHSIAIHPFVGPAHISHYIPLQSISMTFSNLPDETMISYNSSLVASPPSCRSITYFACTSVAFML